MKIKMTVHIHYCKYSWNEKGEYEVFSFKMDDEEHRTYIGEREIEIEVPDNYDPRPQQIAALEEKLRDVMAEFQVTVDSIKERISKLQAITYQPEGEA